MPLVEPEAAETDREAPNRPLSPRSPARSEVPGVRRVEEAIAAIRRGEVSATVVWLGERVRAVDDWMGSEWREVRSKPWKPTAPALFSLNLFLCSPALAIARIVVVVDEHSRDVADLIMPASLATAERMAFMVRHGSGIVSAAASPAVLDRLSIPPMLAGAEGIAKNGSPSSVSVDVAVGTTTGISAADRARTLRALADAHSLPADFCRPGHIFPLRAHPGGVLRQAMRVEAAADMAVLAGLPPVTAVTELLNDDGSLPDAAQTQQFAAQNALTLISIQDICGAQRLARLPTEWGTFDIVSYISDVDGIEHVAMVKGDISSGEDVMGASAQRVPHRRAGEFGLGHKLQAYNLQDMGRDTVQANLDLGMPADAREYSAAAHILRDLGVRSAAADDE
ncbi:unnamed protein product [Closterium sp. NIES-64]|nr:unnamed protein product [Closterium sp. NIES-64]